LPPLTVALQEEPVRESVAGEVLLADAVPAVMFNGDTCLLGYRFEPDLYVSNLIGFKGRLPPCEGEPESRLHAVIRSISNTFARVSVKLPRRQRE
jgi:hypothetical protein